MMITIKFQKPMFIVRAEGEDKLTRQEKLDLVKAKSKSVAKVTKDKTKDVAKVTATKTAKVTRGAATRTSTAAKSTVRKVNEARVNRAVHVLEAARAREEAATS